MGLESPFDFFQTQNVDRIVCFGKKIPETSY